VGGSSVGGMKRIGGILHALVVTLCGGMFPPSRFVGHPETVETLVKIDEVRDLPMSWIGGQV